MNTIQTVLIVTCSLLALIFVTYRHGYRDGYSEGREVADMKPWYDR